MSKTSWSLSESTTGRVGTEIKTDGRGKPAQPGQEEPSPTPFWAGIVTAEEKNKEQILETIFVKENGTEKEEAIQALVLVRDNRSDWKWDF